MTTSQGAAPDGNRQWFLVHRPQGEVADGDLVLRTGTRPAAGPGEVVLRTELLSLDPANRIWMSDMPQYKQPARLGEPMRGGVMGRVVASTVDALPVGSYAMGSGSWSDYCCEPAAHLRPVPAVDGMDPADVFAQFATVGPTAYFGLVDICAPKIGETLVVSGAAGAVGSLVGQLGKALGCRVVGIAGGPDKCAWLDEIGFDATIDYKRENLGERLAVLCPDGIDIFFDNVGAQTLDAVLARMNLFGRISQCGMIATYNRDGHDAAPSQYPRILMKRLKVQGFIASDYMPRYPEAIRALAELHRRGQLQWRNHVIDGLENAVEALRMLFSGANRGKLLVRVAEAQ